MGNPKVRKGAADQFSSILYSPIELLPSETMSVELDDKLMLVLLHMIAVARVQQKAKSIDARRPDPIHPMVRPRRGMRPRTLSSESSGSARGPYPATPYRRGSSYSNSVPRATLRTLRSYRAWR